MRRGMMRRVMPTYHLQYGKSMETTDIAAYVGLAFFGLVVGTLTARSSDKREKIRTDNPAARFFHYLACSIMSIIAPTILVTVFIVHPHWATIGGIAISPFMQLIGIAAILFVLAIALLIPYGTFEKPALAAYAAKQEDRGWTEKDARESGL